MCRKLFVVGLALISITGCQRDSVVRPDASAPTPPPELSIYNVVPTTGPFQMTSQPSEVSFALIGLVDPVREELIPFVAYETVWVLEDDEPVDITVESLDQNEPSAIDMIFVVDNSGSMGDESDRIAEGIISYANALSSAGWDIRFGCIGQNGTVNGGIGPTDNQKFSAYLSRDQGRDRTVGFVEPDSSFVRNWSAQNPGYGENGVRGIRCAEESFSWRSGAVRVFINFTDEPVQSRDDTGHWSTDGYCADWTPGRGTIHTVWSGTDSLATYRWRLGVDDNPADLSACTGGTVLEIEPNATDLDLQSLPFVQTLREAVIVRFASLDTDREHKIEIVVKNGGTADGNLVLPNVRYR